MCKLSRVDCTFISATASEGNSDVLGAVSIPVAQMTLTFDSTVGRSAAEILTFLVPESVTGSSLFFYPLNANEVSFLQEPASFPIAAESNITFASLPSAYAIVGEMLTVSASPVLLQNFTVSTSFFGATTIIVTVCDQYGLTLGSSEIVIVRMSVSFGSEYAIPGYPIAIDATANVSASVPSIFVSASPSLSQTLPVGVTVSTSPVQLINYTVPSTFYLQSQLFAYPLDVNGVSYLQTPASVPLLAVVVSTSPTVEEIGQPLSISASSNINVTCTLVYLVGSNGVSIPYTLPAGTQIAPTTLQLLSVTLDPQLAGSSLINIHLYNGSILINGLGYALPVAGSNIFDLRFSLCCSS